MIKFHAVSHSIFTLLAHQKTYLNPCCLMSTSFGSKLFSILHQNYKTRLFGAQIIFIICLLVYVKLAFDYRTKSPIYRILFNRNRTTTARVHTLIVCRNCGNAQRNIAVQSSHTHTDCFCNTRAQTQRYLSNACTGMHSIFGALLLCGTV